MNEPPPPPVEFSAWERAALAQWRAPLPPADFADRVLSRAATEGERTPAPRGRLAVAAFALIVLGGLLSVRSMLGEVPGAPSQERPGAFDGFDAGQRPETSRDLSEEVSVDVRDTSDGLSGHAS